MPDIDWSEVIRIEEMSLNAWPALGAVHHHGCVFRFAAGYTRRSNSVNALYHDGEIEEIIQSARALYSRNGLPTVFKILAHPRYVDLDAALAAKGYEKDAMTTVKMMAIPDGTFVRSGDVSIEDRFSPEWIEGFIAANRLEPKRETVSAVLNGIMVETIVATAMEDGERVGFGFGAREGGHVGFFDIFIKQDYRGKGYGRKLMETILSTARTAGAQYAYLQVMDNNHPANRLYDGLGFKSAYNYWYRKMNPEEGLWA